MIGVWNASKDDIISYLVLHPDLRPESAVSGPPAKRTRVQPPAPVPRAAPPPQARAPPPARPAPAPADNPPPNNVWTGPSATTGNINTIRGVLYREHRPVPIINPLETPAQEAERRQREWAAIERALDLEEEGDRLIVVEIGEIAMMRLMMKR